MKRRQFISYFLLSYTSLIHAKGIQESPLGKYDAFKFEHQHNNVYVMHGSANLAESNNLNFINNVSLIEAKNGLIIIDSGGSYEIGHHVLEQLKRISSKPIIAIFNTHDHDDHWFANSALKEAYPSLKVYTHKKMRSSADELYGGDYSQRGFIYEKNREKVFADILLDDGDTLRIDGEAFSITHPEHAHTNCDIAITHHNSDTLFTGDLLLSQTLANFGLHSSICGNIDFLEKMNKKSFALYVPGHGPSGNKEACFNPYFHYLSIIKEETQRAVEKEIAFADLKDIKEKILLRFAWEENFHFSYGFVDRYMIHIYEELEAKEWNSET